MKVHIVGIGMGNPDTLTVGAKHAIEQSDLLIGAPRLLDAFSYVDCEKRALIKPGEIAAALAESSCERASVLMSGDVGFYSGATLLYGKLDGYDLDVIPGISSVVYFCAKLHTTWQDAKLVSAHGRAHNAIGAIQSNEKTFCITGGQTKVSDICADMVAVGLADVRVAVGERLSYDDERIVEDTAEALAHAEFADLSVMLVRNPHPIRRAFEAPSLADGDFERGSAPMTKEEVRALSVSKLRVARDHVVWDVGAGTGSVSVELALAAREGRVFAIEKKPAALELLEQTKRAHGVVNMSIVAGAAPEALAGLPAPDRVFIGGSSGNMREIFEVVLDANPQARICATAVTLETLSELLDCTRAFGFADVDIVQLSVARADAIGSYHLMRAENPVYLVTVSQPAS